MYSLDELVETFLRHGTETQEQQWNLIKEHKERYPQEELPKYMNDPFNVSFALHAMCKELLDLKNKKD